MSSNPPVIPRVRKSLTRLNSIHSSISSDSSVCNLLKPDAQTPQSTVRQELVHVVEVHNSKTKLILSSEDEEWAKSNERRKKRPKSSSTSVKKKLRDKRKGEEMESVSELESGGETGPVVEVRRVHRAPTKGSATDTLSDASDTALHPETSLLVPHIKRNRLRAPRKGSATDTLSEESDVPERAGILAPTQPAVTSPVSDSTVNRPKPSSRIPRPSTAHVERRSRTRSSRESTPASLLNDISDNGSPLRQNDSKTSSVVDEMVSPGVGEYQQSQDSVSSVLESINESKGDLTTGSSPPIAAPRQTKNPIHLPPTASHRSKNLSSEKASSMSTDDTKSKLAYSPHRTKHKKSKMSPQLSEKPPSSILTDSEKGESLYGNELVAVTVHGCDPLRFLDFARSPLIRLHAVDSISGENLTREITPLQTKPFHLKINRTVTPCWEEDLIIKEPMRRVASKTTILLFEVIDTGRRERVIAWAFLKLVAPNGADNLAKMLRLQLFKPLARSKTSADKLQCFVWWSKGKYSVYNSTLYVSVNAVPIQDDVTLPNGSDIATEESQYASREGASEDQAESDEEDVVWTRLCGQSCKIPTVEVGRLECGKDGSLCLAFSHSGRHLAAPARRAVLIYDVPKLRLRLSLYNHSGIVHDLSWSPNDEFLLTASADSTACIWAIARKQPTPYKVLSHPTYVYSCCWISNIVAATGCLDGHIRLWAVNSDDQPRFLTRHRARVNALASAVSPKVSDVDYVDSDSEDNEKWLMLSGDSSGVIVLWKEDDESGEFSMEKEVKVRELSNQVVNRIVIVPGSKRFLVLSRDSVIRMIDIASAAVLQYYQGGVCVKTQGSMALCGCARRVWSSSEEGCIMVWDVCSGAQVAAYSDLHGAIALHPLEHMAAVVPHKPDTHPELLVAAFDRSKDGRELGLVLLNQKANRKDWSTRSIPLQPIPAVRIQPPPGLRFSKGSRTPSPRPGAISPAPQFKITQAFSGEIPLKSPDKKEDRSVSKPVVSLEPKASSLQDRDVRLSEIIDKMDTILLHASPKQAACVK